MRKLRCKLRVHRLEKWASIQDFLIQDSCHGILRKWWQQTAGGTQFLHLELPYPISGGLPGSSQKAATAPVYSPWDTFPNSSPFLSPVCGRSWRNSEMVPSAV